MQNRERGAEGSQSRIFSRSPESASSTPSSRHNEFDGEISRMPPLDLAIVVLFVAGCLVLGAWIGRSGRGVRDYFLGERDVPAWAVMISIVATETSAVTFLSVPGNAYREDFRFLQLAFGYVVARILVAIVLLPSYFRNEVQTAYEVLSIRFGGSVRTAASLLFLIARTLGSGLRLFLAAKVLVLITGWDLRLSVVVIGGSTLAYTYLGGLKGVVWADVLQFFVYLGAAVVAIVLLARLVPGGWPVILDRAGRQGKLRVFDFSFDLTAKYTFWSGLLGAMVLDMGTHGADHMMVQRYLTARSQRQAAWALVASGFLILAQFALFLLIGAGIRQWHDLEPTAAIIGKDSEFASFIVAAFPTGLLGLVVAAIFSVTMSTVSGALSSSASSTVNDLIRPRFPSMSDRALMGWSRGMTAFWGIAQVGVALAANGMKQSVVDAALAVASFITGILLGVFLLGLWTKDVRSRAALIGMLAGIAAVSTVAFGTRVAYPWWSPVGAATVLGVGWLAQQFDGGSRDKREYADTDLM
jgi:solute:Na+ symporter, SSS family